MKQYMKFLFITAILTFIFFESTIWGIIKIPENVFYSSYQSVIQDKYRILLETNEPKIIIVSGSSCAFGLDQEMLEEASGYKVVNLGLHAGFGALFYSELAKTNINEGDIVLLGYEYGWSGDDGFEFLGTDLVMTGIDSNIEMYSHIPARKWKSIIGYLFTYANKKKTYEPETGIYSREAFDSETGQLVVRRDYNMEYTPEKYGTVDISNVSISDKSIEYLKDFKAYTEENGAEVYFIAPPLIIDSVVCDYSEFDRLKELEEQEIGIPYISNPTEYLFPAELMSDALYHCNSAGEEVRTELLISDLKKAAVLE